jgi:hypothetical protein
MLELGKLFGRDSGSCERIGPAELADLRGQVKAIGRSQAVIEFAFDAMTDIRTGAQRVGEW